jgi:hypothetical protein
MAESHALPKAVDTQGHPHALKGGALQENRSWHESQYYIYDYSLAAQFFPQAADHFGVVAVMVIFVLLACEERKGKEQREQQAGKAKEKARGWVHASKDGFS